MRSLRESGRRITGSVLYRRDRFAAEDVSQLCEQLERLLRSAVLDPGAPLSDIEILSEREKQILATPMIVLSSYRSSLSERREPWPAVDPWIA